MGFVAPVLGAVGGALGFSGTAATVAGTAAIGAGVASAVNKDVRRVALPVLGGMATGGLLAGGAAASATTGGVLNGSVGLGALGGITKGSLTGGLLGVSSGMKMNEAAKLQKTQEAYYNQQRSLIAKQEADIARQSSEAAKRAKLAQVAQQGALNIETERMAKLQQRMMRGRRRGLFDDSYYGNLSSILG